MRLVNLVYLCDNCKRLGHTETSWTSRDQKEFPAAILDSVNNLCVFRKKASPKHTFVFFIQDDFVRNQQQSYRRNVESQVFGVRFLYLCLILPVYCTNSCFRFGRCVKILLQQVFSFCRGKFESVDITIAGLFFL